MDANIEARRRIATRDLLFRRYCPVLRRSGKIRKACQSTLFVFGGRRAGAIPLVTESFNWRRGTFLGAIVSSETTAAAAGKVGELRRDPMAMLPFCGYNMGRYTSLTFSRWATGRVRSFPVFYVNWFRTDENGKFLWPGYGENSRVLKWIFERCDGKVHAVETAIGRLPEPANKDTKGLDLSAAGVARFLTVDVEGWHAEIPLIREYFARFGSHLAEALNREVTELEGRLWKAKK